MIPPAAFPVTSALTALATIPAAPGEAGEIVEAGAGFAVLLDLRCDATAEEGEPAIPLANLLTAMAAPAKPEPDGKTLPDATPSPQSPATDEKPDPAEPAEDSETSPVLAGLPILQPTAPLPRAPVSPSAPKAKAELPAMKPASAAASNSPAPASSEAEAPPRLALSLPDEKSVPAEPIRSLVAAPLAETAMAPAATIQHIATTPQASPAPTAGQPHVRHDFAALVDRLVEARDAALTVKAPQSVAAAIAHSEFGEVSIRFEHRGDALSVSLASADPDFTRAVHAAAPVAQTNATGDNGAQPQRQDGAGQHAATGSGSQSQPQQRQGSARHAIQQEHDDNKRQQPTRQPTSGSIFA